MRSACHCAENVADVSEQFDVADKALLKRVNRVLIDPPQTLHHLLPSHISYNLNRRKRPYKNELPIKKLDFSKQILLFVVYIIWDIANGLSIHSAANR